MESSEAFISSSVSSIFGFFEDLGVETASVHERSGMSAKGFMIERKMSKLTSRTLARSLLDRSRLSRGEVLIVLVLDSLPLGSALSC